MEDSYKERRSEARKKLIYYLKVFDEKNAALIGNLVDITANGMMVISEEPLEMNKDFRLRISLPRMILGQEEIIVNARSLWCQNDINPILYDSGFQFSGLTHSDKNIIEDLLASTSFDS